MAAEDEPRASLSFLGNGMTSFLLEMVINQKRARGDEGKWDPQEWGWNVAKGEAKWELKEM